VGFVIRRLDEIVGNIDHNYFADFQLLRRQFVDLNKKKYDKPIRIKIWRDDNKYSLRSLICPYLRSALFR
jgi:hypothetical protein